MPGSDANSVFYVYLLLKTPLSGALIGKGFDPSNVLYVGKGRGYRWRQHFEEAANVAGPKSAAIIAALGRDPSPETIERHALIVAGHLSESEACRLEAIMIHLAGGLPALSNVVAGHAAPELMVPAFDARVFFGAEDLQVDAWNVRGTGRQQAELRAASPAGAVVFAVKGTADSLNDVQWTRTNHAGRFPRSTLMAQVPSSAVVRRGWDPHAPWTESEARARARSRWIGSPTSVALWQQLIRARGGYLALLVPDPRNGQSVVRYVWKLKPNGQWDDYEGDRFGFPIGARVADHPWLGRRLVRQAAGGKLVGVLHGRPASPAVMLWR